MNIIFFKNKQLYKFIKIINIKYLKKRIKNIFYIDF